MSWYILNNRCFSTILLMFKFDIVLMKNTDLRTKSSLFSDLFIVLFWIVQSIKILNLRIIKKFDLIRSNNFPILRNVKKFKSKAFFSSNFHLFFLLFDKNWSKISTPNFFDPNRRLRSPKNNLHMKLFLSFILRCVLFHLKRLNSFTDDLPNLDTLKSTNSTELTLSNNLVSILGFFPK